MIAVVALYLNSQAGVRLSAHATTIRLRGGDEQTFKNGIQALQDQDLLAAVGYLDAAAHGESLGVNDVSVLYHLGLALCQQGK